jgi:hypothetical protein
MSSGYTKGPWSASEHGDYSDYDGRCIVILGDDDTIKVAAVIGDDDEETNATARLIAAAPELLEALVEIRDLFDMALSFGLFPRNAREGSPKAKADAAIAKATGATP